MLPVQDTVRGPNKCGHCSHWSSNGYNTACYEKIFSHKIKNNGALLARSYTTTCLVSDNLPHLTFCAQLNENLLMHCMCLLAKGDAESQQSYVAAFIGPIPEVLTFGVEELSCKSNLFTSEVYLCIQICTL